MAAGTEGPMALHNLHSMGIALVLVTFPLAGLCADPEPEAPPSANSNTPAAESMCLLVELSLIHI